ncbi:MAG TPA: MarR family transcriptional regulator [Pirellulales bacterium]|jgi:DNA-binding MarR family transcriptional regulator|nr:MarR family transcriptional regulator [Pirellulales bacterium]
MKQGKPTSILDKDRRLKHRPSAAKRDGNDLSTWNLHDQKMNSEQIAQDVTTLLMSLMRDLFAVEDDQASELPLRQLRVCAMLYEGARSMSSLSRELDVSLPAMTQIADRLERAGLVKRSLAGTDRRVRSLQLTARAQRIMRLRESGRVDRASAALQQLSPPEQVKVLSTLQLLLTACAASKTNGNGVHPSSVNGSVNDKGNGADIG